MLDLFGNIADIIWRGANGELVQAEITARFAGEAYIHWSGGKEEWKCLRVPMELRDRVKIYGSAYLDEAFWWPVEEDEDVIGCIVGTADTPAGVIESIQECVDALKDENISVRMESFIDLISEIESAEEQGIEFSDEELPTVEQVLNKE
jgi:hypothetical protein